MVVAAADGDSGFGWHILDLTHAANVLADH
jgi:hypothetical protein